MFLTAFLGTARERGGEVTGAVLFLTTSASLAVFLLESVMGTHWPMDLMTTLALLIVPFLGIEPQVPAVFLFFVFQIAFWGLKGLANPQGRRLASEIQKGRRSRSKAAMAALLSAVFLVSFLVVSSNVEWFFQAAYNAEGVLMRTAKQVSGRVENPNNGAVSRGNLYPAGMEQLQVQTDKEPTETIYLRGFTGGDYRDGEWQPADDTSVFALMNENTLHWDQWESWIAGMYDTMYFVLNSSMGWADNPVETRELWIRQGENVREQWYTPYFSMWNRRDRYQGGYGENEYGYQYYELGEMKVDWGSIPPDMETLGEWYYEIQDAYMKEIGSVYTSVPTEDLSRLAQLCADNPVESSEEATALILSILQNSAVYTRTPGLFPMNQDPVEYFLFEGQEGYCQHFASAAVLMYRLYGIPARYTTGYAVSPSAFEPQADGTYLAVVTDESAHAWPEIFLEDYGWVPIEATPSGDNTVPVFPGMDRGLLEEFMAGQNWNLEVLQQSEPVNSESENASDTQDASFGLVLPQWQVQWEWVLFLLFLVVWVFLLYRMSRLRGMEIMDVRKAFAGIRKALHFAGLLKEYDHSEEDLILQLPGVTPEITDGQARKLLLLVQAASFGRVPVEEAKEEEVRGMYRQIVKSIYRRLPLWKKPLFKYGKSFL